MTIQNDTDFEAEYTEELEIVGYDFGMSRRSFMQVLGAGLLISVAAPAVLNAVFAATGMRIGTLPLKDSKLL